MKIFLAILFYVFILIPTAFVLIAAAFILISLLLAVLVYTTEFMARNIFCCILFIIHIITIPFKKLYEAIKNILNNKTNKRWNYEKGR